MIYIIGMACMTGTLSAQTVVDYSLNKRYWIIAKP